MGTWPSAPQPGAGQGKCTLVGCPASVSCHGLLYESPVLSYGPMGQKGSRVDLQITCIIRSSSHGSCEHITHAGNPASQGVWTVEQVVQSIDAQQHTFFVRDASTGRRANVGVVHESGKRSYIRTYADGYWNDNLLSLTSCPWRAAA